MIVVSRKRDESLIIGDGIVVTVVSIHDDKVRIGIEAPREVPVHRKEIHEGILRSEQASPSDEPPKSLVQDQPSFEEAIEILLKASSRMSPVEEAAARLLLKAARTKLK